MRPAVICVLIVLLVTSATAGTSPQFADPAHDFHVAPWPAVGFPDPAIDLRLVEFFVVQSELMIRITVEDLGFTFPSLAVNRAYILTFVTDIHAMVILTTSSREDGREWYADIQCMDAEWSMTCTSTLDPMIDLSASSFTLVVPKSILGTAVLRPRMSSVADYPFSVSMQAGIMDYAPNCQVTVCPPGPSFEIG